MAALRDIMAYIIQQYPRPNEIAKGRLAKMIYLADWASAQKHGKQVSSIKWYFNNHGPYVSDVFNLAQSDQAFTVQETTNKSGGSMHIIGLQDQVPLKVSLTDWEKSVLDSVIVKVCDLRSWSDFVRHVYDTYPVASQPRYTSLDLVALAKNKTSS